MKKYKPMLVFNDNLKARIVRCWQHNRQIRWQYGMVIPTWYGVAVCTKGRVIRDEIRSEDIAEYIVKEIK